jgi:histidyl-tRNA synthetase
MNDHTGKTVPRPPGVRDVLPDEAHAIRQVVGQLEADLERFGYQLVDTPVVEYADLFLTKVGDDLLRRLYEFELRGRSLCLRPEYTAAIARLYVENLQHHPKPIRLQFSGPIFRYETFGSYRSRQTTVVGAELLGASGPVADAEIVGLAHHALRSLGIGEPKLILGNIGLIARCLQHFDLDRQTQQLIIGQIENLRRPDRGRGYVMRQLGTLMESDLDGLLGAALPSEDERPVGIDDGLEAEDEIARVVDVMLGSAVVDSHGSRSLEEIASRLSAKLRRARQREDIVRALEFVEGLCQLHGTPGQVLDVLRERLRGYGAALETLNGLAETIGLLPYYGLREEQIELEVGLARGVAYHTDIIFEIHAPTGPAQHVCSGGRYDDLLQLLGSSQPVPAAGFSIYVEPVIEALDARWRVDASTRQADFLVLAVTNDEVAHSIRAAQALRELGARVELDCRPATSLKTRLGYADKRGFPYAVIVGPDEVESGTLSLREMATKRQTQWPLEDAARLLKELGILTE